MKRETKRSVNQTARDSRKAHEGGGGRFVVNRGPSSGRVDHCAFGIQQTFKVYGQFDKVQPVPTPALFVQFKSEDGYVEVNVF